MKTDDKAYYIKRWQEYIEGLSPLCFTKDAKLSERVRVLKQELFDLVPAIADTKKFEEVKA